VKARTQTGHPLLHSVASAACQRAGQACLAAAQQWRRRGLTAGARQRGPAQRGRQASRQAGGSS